MYVRRRQSGFRAAKYTPVFTVLSGFVDIAPVNRAAGDPGLDDVFRFGCAWNSSPGAELSVVNRDAISGGSSVAPMLQQNFRLPVQSVSDITRMLILDRGGNDG